MAEDTIIRMEADNDTTLLMEEEDQHNGSTNFSTNNNSVNKEEESFLVDKKSNREEEEDEESILIMKMLQLHPPPDAFPDGWIMKRCTSQPGYAYYFHQHTGVSQWELPSVSINNSNDTEKQDQLNKTAEAILAAMAKQQNNNSTTAASADATIANSDAAAGSSKVRSILKKRHAVKMETAEEESKNNKTTSSSSSPQPPEPKKSKSHHKRKSSSSSNANASSSSSSSSNQIRCLHILKKHSGSRNPYSWRYKKKQVMIQLSKKGAIGELKELLEILAQSNTSAEDLRATFEELARTESDCSSARKGGDLGYFGKGAMQPAFEKACYVLKPGKMSGVVVTDSGVHVILRLA